MKNNNGLSIALGVCGIVISIIGGMTFGIIGAIIGLACSVGGIILGINTQKATGGAQGKGGFICGIIGAAFGVIFFIGCLACGGSYGKWGCVGGCNSASKDIDKAWKDAGLDDINWNDLLKD